MRAPHRRPGATADLLHGPAELCQAFGIDGAFDGADLVTGDRGVTIVDDGEPPPDVPAVSDADRALGGHRAPVALVHPGFSPPLEARLTCCWRSPTSPARPT